MGQVVHLLRQPDELQDGRHLGLDDVLGAADDLEREGDVLPDRLVGKQLEVLEDAPDVAPQIRHPPPAEATDVLAGDEDLALVGLFFFVEQAQEGRLPRSRRSDEEHELTLLDVAVRLVQGEDLALVDLRDVLELDHEIDVLQFPGGRAEGRTAGVNATTGSQPNPRAHPSAATPLGSSLFSPFLRTIDPGPQ